MKRRSWSASLKIEVNGVCKEINYYFVCIRKYSQLYDDLPSILEKLEWSNKSDKNKTIIKDTNQVEFYFTYLGKKIKVDDWEKYILNKEKIDIHINTESKPVYALVDSYQGDKVITSTNINDLYSYYEKQKHLFNNTYPMLIYSVDIRALKTKLLDVIENSQAHLNACINRMVSKYNY